MAEKKGGVIYILTNPSFPNYIKIGYADNIEKRLKQLNRSECIPFAFRVYAVYHVEKPLQDKELHSIIDSLNPDLRAIDTFDGKTRTKEFYAMSPEDAYSLLESIAKLSSTEGSLQRMTPEGHEVLDEEIAAEVQEEAKERKSPFSFEKCGISAGSEIQWADDPSYVATVIDDKHVVYEGVTYSTSGLTRELMKTVKDIDMPAWQGPIHWTYNGKLLNDIRTEREEKGLYK